MLTPPIMHYVFDLSCRVSRAKRDRRVHNNKGGHCEQRLLAHSSTSLCPFLFSAGPVSRSHRPPQHCHTQQRNAPLHSYGHWTGALLPHVPSGGGEDGSEFPDSAAAAPNLLLQSLAGVIWNPQWSAPVHPLHSSPHLHPYLHARLGVCYHPSGSQQPPAASGQS